MLIDFSMGDFHRFPNHQTPHFPTQLAEALHGEDHAEIYRATAATDQTISAHGLSISFAVYPPFWLQTNFLLLKY